MNLHRRWQHACLVVSGSTIAADEASQKRLTLGAHAAHGFIPQRRFFQWLDAARKVRIEREEAFLRTSSY